MKAKLLLTTIASFAFASASNAALIAGWDFSQYAVAGFVSLDGATLSNTLDANHSDLDPSNRAGIESNQYGTMHIDGLFGSFATPLDFADPFQPIDLPPAGSLTSNASQAFLGFGSPAACTQQQIEGMPFANCTNIAMTTLETVAVVFEANPGATDPLQWGENWSISFAARTVSGGGVQTIGVEFSPDGSGYVSVGTANLTGVDTAYTFAAPVGFSANGFFRLTLNSGAELPALDNVGIAASLLLVPEPGTAMLLLVGLAGLAKAGKRRD